MMAYTQMTMRHSHGSQAFATHGMLKSRNGGSMNVDRHRNGNKAVLNAVKRQNGAYGMSRVSLEKTSHFGKTVCQAASSGQTDAAPGKLISKVEIPSFIPRSDLMDQLLRWALIELQENGVASVGCQCKVGGLDCGDRGWECQRHEELFRGSLYILPRFRTKSLGLQKHLFLKSC